MTEQDGIHDRGKALEDLFYKNLDAKLIDDMRKDLQQKEIKEALAHASGISNEQVLDELVKHKVNAETWASVSLIPLVAVAWADGNVDLDERKAIMDAMAKNNLDADSPSSRLVSSWLNSEPGSELFETWQHYVATLKQQIDHAALSQMHNAVMERAINVAKSAGGFLGIGSISAKEQKVLDQLDEAFKE